MHNSVLYFSLNPDLGQTIEQALQPNYKIDYANFDQLGERFAQVEPQLVVIDSDQGEFDALALCEQVNGLASSSSPSCILYLGKKGGLEERWLAYEAGADDYLDQPFTQQELRYRAHGLAKALENRESFLAREQSARDVAVQSMREAHQYGLILQFIRKTNHCEDCENLASIAFEAISQLGLMSSIQIRDQNETINLRSTGEWCSPLEVQLFEQLKNQGRIFEYQNRCIFNDTHVSILIKNMPEDDEQRGRLRDILAYVLEGLEATYIQINQRNALMGLLSDCRNTVSLIEESFSNHAHQTVEIMDSTMMDMQEALHYLNLTEEQEQYFIELVNKNMTQLLSVHNDSQMIDKAFSAIIKKLETALNK